MPINLIRDPAAVTARTLDHVQQEIKKLLPPQPYWSAHDCGGAWHIYVDFEDAVDRTWHIAARLGLPDPHTSDWGSGLSWPLEQRIATAEGEWHTHSITVIGTETRGAAPPPAVPRPAPSDSEGPTGESTVEMAVPAAEAGAR